MENGRLSRPGTGPDMVYAGLRRLIIEQVLVPGERLPESAVATRFAVSRTVVRSALDRLAAEGLVVRPNNRGARVASPSVAEVADLFAIREAVEAVVMERLGTHLPEGAVERLLAHVERERQAGGNDRSEAIRLSGEFHVLLAELTGSAALTRYVSDLVSRCSLVLVGDVRQHSSECGIEEHLGLIEHLRTGSPFSARAAMVEHLHAVAQRSLSRRKANA